MPRAYPASMRVPTRGTPTDSRLRSTDVLISSNLDLFQINLTQLEIGTLRN
jgi:hypothetical protein